MKDLERNALLDVIEDITEKVDELLAQKENQNDFNSGQLLAYADVLEVIQDFLAGYDLKEFKLDYDIEKKYLLGG